MAGGGADCLECVLGVPAPGVPDRGNFSFGPGFAGHAVLAGVDVWGRVESTDATAPVLALGVTNYYGQRANDACQEPCGILPWMGPETTVAVQASVCNPNGLGLFGVPDPISEECPFISPGSGTYSYNGRVRHPGSACSHAGACQDHAATTSLSHEPLLADLRGASFVEPLQRTSCGTMDVAVRRVHIGVLPSPADWRLMPAGVRLVRQ